MVKLLVVLVVFLKFSKAFDTVGCQFLLQNYATTEFRMYHNTSLK